MEFARFSWRWHGCHHRTWVWNLSDMITGGRAFTNGLWHQMGMAYSTSPRRSADSWLMTLIWSVSDFHLVTCLESIWYVLFGINLQFCCIMRSQTCQNTSTDSFTTPEHALSWNWSASCHVIAWTLSTVHVLRGLCVSSFTTTLWLTSCSICCRFIKQTDHINSIDWVLLRTRHIWFPLSALHTHTYTSKLLDSFDLYYAS